MKTIVFVGVGALGSQAVMLMRNVKATIKVIDMDRRLVAFMDKSVGEITTWKWDFGDNTDSADQNPIHQYKEAGKYVVILTVEGPGGKSRLSKVWDVIVR